MKKESTIVDGLTIAHNYISIDFNLWTTQAALTAKLGCNRNVINNRVRRGEQNGTLRTYYIEQLGIKLIPNVNDINELC